LVLENPHVFECVVVSPEATLNCAYVTLKKKDSLMLEEEINRDVKERVARSTNGLFVINEIVVLEEIPRTAIGKVTRKGLRNILVDEPITWSCEDERVALEKARFRVVR
jgi:acyl-coenzyme A synthetase/AMP-(fatty) acid ligase